MSRLIEFMILAMIAIMAVMVVGGTLLGIVCAMEISPGWTAVGLGAFVGLTAWFYVSGASMGEL